MAKSSRRHEESPAGHAQRAFLWLVRHPPILSHTDHPHPVVDPVSDIQIALGVYAAAVGPLQAGCRGGAAVAIATLVPAGDGGHDTSHGINAADRIVFCVHDNNV